MRTIINIGLNNNPYNYDSVVQFMETHFIVTSADYQISSYEGSEEPTAVIHIKGEISTHTVELLCDYFKQESIAVLDNVHKGRLIYTPFFTREKHTFDLQYFLI